MTEENTLDLLQRMMEGNLHKELRKVTGGKDPDSETSKALVRASRTTTGINRIAAIPSIAAIKALIKDPSKEQDALSALATFQTLAAAPTLINEGYHAFKAIQNAGSDWEEKAKKIFPLFGAYALSKLTPVAITSAAKMGVGDRFFNKRRKR